METGFSQYHPTVQFLLLASIMAVTMTVMDPVLLLISNSTALLYLVYTGGKKAIFTHLKLTSLTSLMIIIINPLISHRGVTILTYLPDGNALTLESVVFGIAAAFMLSCIFAWCFTVNRVFTSDKVICLFGSRMPKLALLISMTLNFTEKFTNKLRQVTAVQSALGRDIKKGNPLKRIKDLAAIISIMLQWAMENSVDTADSMKSRGYGLKKRTSYTVYRIFPRDITLAVLILLCDIFLIAAFLNGVPDSSYYPYFSLGKQSAMRIAVYLSFAAICAAPLIIDLREDGKWRSIRSKI